MRTLASMKFLLATMGFSGYWAGSEILTRSGREADVVRNMDVRSIRQNPGSFRSQYLPYFRYTGGK